MIREDLFVFETGLKLCKFNHPRLTNAVTQNKRVVGIATKDIRDSIEPEGEYAKYVEEAGEIAKKHCKKDEQGRLKYVTIPSENQDKDQKIYDVDTTEGSEFLNDLDVLNKKYKQVLDDRIFYMNEFNKSYMKEECEIEIVKVPLSILEKQWDGLSVEDREKKYPQELMDKIYWMIQD
jgi:hypothetical protein